MLRKMLHFENESSEGRITAPELVKDEWLTKGGREPFNEEERVFGEILEEEPNLLQVEEPAAPLHNF